MDYDGFIARNNGKQITAWGGECVALIAQYLADNGKPIVYANAKDWAGNAGMNGNFTWVANNPSDVNQVPKRGDIVVWNGGLPGSGGYGHIAIFDRVSAPGQFVSFDQNWGGRQAHFVTHNWGNVAGWFTPKAAPAPMPGGGTNNMFQNDNEVKEAYLMLRGNEGSAGERAGWIGRSKQDFFKVARAEADSTRAVLAGAQVELKKIQDAINAQNKVITDLNTTNNATKAQYQEAVAKLADLNAQLTTAHDTIKDLQNKPTAVIDEKAVVTNILVRFWNSLFKKG